MSRAYTPDGRFTSDFERGSISSGITADLTNPVGTHAQWWIYNPTDTAVDPIYDVGDSYLNGSGGKMWTGPYQIQVIRAIIKQGDTKISQQGFYNADYLHLTLNALDIEKIAPGTMANPDSRDRDRIVWKGEVFRPYKSQQEGIISEDFILLTVDLVQVMPEELVNDVQFSAYAN
jgi:hypothetical protein